MKVSLIVCQDMLSHVNSETSGEREIGRKMGGGREAFPAEKKPRAQQQRPAGQKEAGSRPRTSEQELSSRPAPLPAVTGLEELGGDHKLPKQPGGVGNPCGLARTLAPRKGLPLLSKLRD